jgi:hypothetical protein
MLKRAIKRDALANYSEIFSYKNHKYNFSEYFNIISKTREEKQYLKIIIFSLVFPLFIFY